MKQKIDWSRSILSNYMGSINLVITIFIICSLILMLRLIMSQSEPANVLMGLGILFVVVTKVKMFYFESHIIYKED